MAVDPTAGDGVYRLLWTRPWKAHTYRYARQRTLIEMGCADPMACVKGDVDDAFYAFQNNPEALRRWVRRLLELCALEEECREQARAAEGDRSVGGLFRERVGRWDRG